MLEKIQFFKSFISNPQVIGSIFPSSKRLANIMVKELNYENADYIVELGAGTGVFTKPIYENKKYETKFVVFEKEENMIEILKSKFPNLEIYKKAEELAKVLKGQKIDYIVSGIPFTVIGKDLRETILNQVYDSLEIGGKFITFQYSLDLKKYLKNKYKNVKVKYVPINIPPAFVYICTK